uniref:NS4 n=1 Tax=Yunnan orbivirus TaxID=306276 RepID=A0A650F673_9REOV|nr:NS4 [Yunnan orbivirus]
MSTLLGESKTEAQIREKMEGKRENTGKSGVSQETVKSMKGTYYVLTQDIHDKLLENYNIAGRVKNRRLRDLELVRMAAMRGYLAPEVVPFPYNQLNQFHILEITPLTERKPLHLCPHCWESQKQKHKYEKRWKERERTPERVESFHPMVKPKRNRLLPLLRFSLVQDSELNTLLVEKI